jgi:hypothetical protein
MDAARRDLAEGGCVASWCRLHRQFRNSLILLRGSGAACTGIHPRAARRYNAGAVKLRNSVLLALFSLPLAAALPEHPRLLFNKAGVEALQKRVQKPEWSAQWRAFQSTYDAGMNAAIELPPRGSNWYHWYVCPRHGARLATGRRTGPWTWEHICPTDNEILKSAPSNPKTDFDGFALASIHSRYATAVRDGGVLYQVTRDSRYAERVRAILLAYAAKYLDYPLHTINAEAKIGGGRVGPQTLDEAVWLIPMAQGADLIWDTLSEADRQTLADKLFLPAARDVILPHKMGVHNIQCWKNSAVGLAGFLLGDNSLLQAAIDDPERGYRTQMAKGVQGDGVWFEGAWGYHFYTLSALWPLTEAARNSGIDLYGEPLRKMFLAPILLAMPNMTLPAFNDSTESPVRNALYELAFARYSGYGTPLLTKGIPTPRRGDFALWFGKDEVPFDVQTRPESHNFTDSGYAILSSQAAWLCLKYGPHGGGHGHPDKNNFILFAGGKVLFPDPGTRPYGSALHTEWDRATVAHNTLVVDGKDQAFATGKSLAFGRDYAMTDAGSIYPGVRFVRTAAMVSDNVVVFVDRITADREHTYDLANHYTGSWDDLPAGAPVMLPYLHVQDAMKRAASTLRAGAIGVTVAGNAPTDVITATGPGRSTAERIPMSIFRRTARDTTYVWAVALDGSAVKLEVEAGGMTKVRVAGTTVTVDTTAATVKIER